MSTAAHTLEDLVRRLHKAKGRYHTQHALCDLFEAVGLKGERPETKTVLADAPWPKREETAPKRRHRPMKRVKMPNGEGLDMKFNEWVAKNNVDLQDIPMMKGNRK